MKATERKKILVAPLNWGLGHASRCVVIVNFLIENNFEPVIASDGDALVFFRKEFPDLKYHELPSYDIKYSKKRSLLKLKLLFSSFSIIKAVREEQSIVEKLVKQEKFHGIISDNRFGVLHASIPSVYMTHQLCVLSGHTTFLTSFIHQRIVSKFDECWVPDCKGENSLGGKLSMKQMKNNISIKYLGPISRLQFVDVEKKYDLLIVLSGPEPQRTLLEVKLLQEIKKFEGKVALVRGVLAASEITDIFDNVEVFNYVLTHKMQELINQSEIVISRSGYSSIMDLWKLGKKTFFIPTPGQSEQEYLAEFMRSRNIAPYANQKDFKIEYLDQLATYSGFEENQNIELDKSLLQIFK